RIVREARSTSNDAAQAIAEALYRRRLLDSPDVPDELSPDEDRNVPAPQPDEPVPAAVTQAIAARLPLPRDGEILTLRRADARSAGRLRGRRRRDLFLHGPEYGPADGAAVEISDSFTLEFGEAGFLRASRIHGAGPDDEEDARA